MNVGGLAGRWGKAVTLCALAAAVFCWAVSGADAWGDEGSAPGESFFGKKILWVDSYDADYAWSQGLERGLRKALVGSGAELRIWRMDTRRNGDEVYARKAGQQALAALQRYAPDVVIASDDNAQKYLVVPYLRGTGVPVVFCGVNRDPAAYGYPCRNVTGMREVDVFDNQMERIFRFAAGRRIGLIAGDTEVERAVAASCKKKYGDRLKIYLVRTFAEFQQAFLRAQQETDILDFRNHVGIENWNDSAAERFLADHTRIPTFSEHPWMKKSVVFCLAKQPEEHGHYAASTALRILAGGRPGDFPVKDNEQARLTVNLKMAKAAGIVLPVSLLQTADIIGREAYRKEPVSR